MAKDLDPQAFEPPSPSDCNDEFTVEVTLDSTPDNVECNVAPAKFPASKRAVAKALGTSDMTIGRWCTALGKKGVQVLESGKVTETGYTHLVALKEATQDRGIKLAEYLDTLTPDPVEAETVEAELMEPITRLGNDPVENSQQYGMVVSKQQSAIAVTGARLDLQRQQAMEALQNIAQAKQKRDAMAVDVHENQRKKWDLEIIQKLGEEASYKLTREEELRQQLGI